MSLSNSSTYLLRVLNVTYLMVSMKATAIQSLNGETHFMIEAVHCQQILPDKTIKLLKHEMTHFTCCL